MKELDKNTHVKNIKPLIVTGFSTILVLIILLIGFWSKSLSDNKQLLFSMADKNLEAGLITEIFTIVHNQTTVLHDLSSEENPIKQDILYKEYLNSDIKLISIFEQLTSIGFKNSEKQSWTRIQRQLTARHRSEKSASDFYENGEYQKAYRYLPRNITPINDKLLGELSSLLNQNVLYGTSDSVNGIIAEATDKNSTTYFLVFLLGGISIILGVFTIFILKRTGTTEEALVDQGERIQLLYEATSISGLSLDDRITETLKLGCKVLGMEIGKLGRQYPENNESVFLNTIAPSELPAKRGLVLPLDKTFCNITFSSSGPIAIHHVSESSYKDHPAAEFLGMEAYIGTTIYVHDKKFGTVNFSNRQPMDKPFTQTDVDFVNLLGKWISVTMEQIIIEEELQESKDAAEAANHAKTAFLANMSHEIRTPLTAILGYSEMLLDEDQSKEDMEHEIKSIITSGSHLQKIINDILDLSKIEAGQLVVEYRDISPVSFMDELNTILGQQASEKGLSFNVHYHYPIPGKIRTDPTRLKQILINLCGNSIKFTQEGAINIALNHLTDVNQMQFTVTDTGIGMSEDEQEKIFKPFTQADESTTRIYGGTGLGLCISKQLAQTLGGDVTVTSEKDKGSCFTVTIDICIEHDKQEMISSASTHDETLTNTSFNLPKLNGHVLLVEDNTENQRLISKSIAKTGLTVDIAENGKIGVEKARENDYSLILMDMQMPVMGGIEATQQLRESGYMVPIISLTANAMQEDKNSCLAAGANDYLAKPLDFNRFYEVLTTYITQKSHHPPPAGTHAKAL